MPPPIQSTMTVSAVALSFSTSGFASAENTARGKPAASAESVAALAVFRKSRRDQFSIFMSTSSCRVGENVAGILVSHSSRVHTSAASVQ
jgi:hypothetical protein